MFLINYFTILLFLILACVLGFIIFGIPLLLSKKQNDLEKLSSYECGFNPFETPRSEFDIKFYIVAILFIVFDLEISFLFPFVISLNQVSCVSIYAMFYFLIILTVGFYYE
jgi:NADH:ubiquinone oxidoreductase subunit 3 (subunit A)